MIEVKKIARVHLNQWLSGGEHLSSQLCGEAQIGSQSSQARA
jgi:hypothetical protein